MTTDHFDVYAFEQTLRRAQALASITRIATQQPTDAITREILYEVMRAIEDLLDKALHGLIPLKDEAEQALDATLRALSGREGDS
jgi:hypothetical protein